MPTPRPQRVHASAAAWVFLPPSAPRVETEEFLVVRYPTWWEHPLQLVRFRPRRPVVEVLGDALDAAAGLTGGIAPRIDCWVRLDAADGLEEALVAAGGRPDETLDVLAADLGDVDLDALAPSRDVALRWSCDPDALFDAATLGADVFGGTRPDRAALEAEFPDEAEKHRTGGGGAVVAYLDDRPVGIGGVTVADRDARLWGGGVLPEARGRGIYRALLAARLTYAIEHGADLGLVKGRVETSGPILRRAGFAPYGQERSYLVDLGSTSAQVALRPAGS